MINKNILFIIFYLTTCFQIQSLNATLSEAFNGCINEEQKSSNWQKEKIEAFEIRTQQRSLIFECVKSYIQDSSFKTEDEHIKTQNMAIYNFLSAEAEKVKNQQMFFEGSLGNQVNDVMKDPITMGKSLRLRRDIKTLEREIEDIKKQKTNDSSIEEIKKIDEKKSQLKLKIEQLTIELFYNVFTKYISWFNLYISLKNSELDYYNREDEIEFLPPTLSAIIANNSVRAQQQLDSRKKSILENMRETTINVVQNSSCSSEQKLKLSKAIQGLSNDYLSEKLFKDNTLFKEQENNLATLETIKIIDLIKNKVTHYFDKLKLLSENDVVKKDFLLIILSETLLNNNFSNKHRADMTSFKFMKSTFTDKDLEETKKAMSEFKDYWKISQAQIRMKFSEMALTFNDDKRPGFYNISCFINDKIQKAALSAINYAELFHPNRPFSLVDVFKHNNFKISNQSKTVTKTLQSRETGIKAAFKIINYMNMCYFLTYDFQGNKNNKLEFVPHEVSIYIKQDFTPLSLDRIFMSKAIKWYNKFLKLADNHSKLYDALNMHSLFGS